MTTRPEINQRLAELPNNILAEIYEATIGYNPFEDGATREQVINTMQTYEGEIILNETVLDFGF